VSVCPGRLLSTTGDEEKHLGAAYYRREKATDRGAVAAADF
jgi:hypothetical protein